MKLRATALLLLALFAFAPIAAHAQSRVYAKDLGGTFEMNFEIDEADIAEAESALDRIAMRAVQTMFEELTVRFTFEDDGQATVVSHAFGSEPTAEETTWSINDAGQLIIADIEVVSLNGNGEEDTLWMWDDGELRAYDAENGRLESSGVTLRPVD